MFDLFHSRALVLHELVVTRISNIFMLELHMSVKRRVRKIVFITLRTIIYSSISILLRPSFLFLQIHVRIINLISPRIRALTHLLVSPHPRHKLDHLVRPLFLVEKLLSLVLLLQIHLLIV